MPWLCFGSIVHTLIENISILLSDCNFFFRSGQVLDLYSTESWNHGNRATSNFHCIFTVSTSPWHFHHTLVSLSEVAIPLSFAAEISMYLSLPCFLQVFLSPYCLKFCSVPLALNCEWHDLNCWIMIFSAYYTWQYYFKIWVV